MSKGRARDCVFHIVRSYCICGFQRCCVLTVAVDLGMAKVLRIVSRGVV